MIRTFSTIETGTGKKEDKTIDMVKQTTRKIDSGTSASGPGASITGPKVRKVALSTLPPTGRGHGKPAEVLAMPFWGDLIKQMKDGLGPNEAFEIEVPDKLLGPSGEEMPVKRFAARIRYQFGLQGFDKKYTLLVPGGSDARRLFVVDHETAAMHETGRRK